MTINELHIAFKVAMDKNAAGVAFGGCPAFLPAEIDLFLNQAYIEVINNKFTGTNTLKTPFEGSVKRIADLEKLIATDSAVAITLDKGTNVLRVSDFFNSAGAKHRMFFVQAVLNFNTNKSTVDLVDHETAKRFLKTYNNDPWINTPVATLENNNLLSKTRPSTRLVSSARKTIFSREINSNKALFSLVKAASKILSRVKPSILSCKNIFSSL